MTGAAFATTVSLKLTEGFVPLMALASSTPIGAIDLEYPIV